MQKNLYRPVRLLFETETRLWNLLHKTVSEKLDLTLARVEVLYAISELNAKVDSVKLNDVSDFLTITTGNASKIVENLVQKKLVSRIVAQNDRRITNLTLTSSGEKILEESFKIMNPVVEKYFPIKSQELSQLNLLLENLRTLPSDTNL